MDKHDPTVKNILAVAIALLYAILVYFFVVTLFPENETGDIFFQSSDNLEQVATAVVIALATVIIAISSLRHIYELLRGFVAGGGMVLLIAAFMLLTFNESLGRDLLLLAIFIFMTGGMYYAEKSIDPSSSSVKTKGSQEPTAADSQPQ